MGDKKNNRARPRPIAKRALARPGDPLVLPSGEIVQEEDVAPPLDTSNPQRAEGPLPAEYRAISRRTLKELPALGSVMNAVSVVFAYTMFGIGDSEIMEALTVDKADLIKIREHKAYAELFNAVMNEFVNTNSEMIQSRIAAYAHVAAQTVGHLVKSAKKEETRLSASKDILDRAGARPVDLAGRQAAQMGEFRITIIKPEKEVHISVNGQDFQDNL